MKTTAQKLEAEMAKAVSLIVAASHAAAVETLNEAFGLARQASNRRGEASQRGSATSRGPSSPRRSRAEIAALETQFLDAVWATPGEAMNVLSARLAVSVSDLQLPVARLKSTGRLKAVGSRQFTRYFPMERDDQGPGKTGG